MIMKLDKRYILSSLLVIVIVLLGIGVTYSYFAAVVINNPSEYDITVNAGDLKISYLDGTSITDENIVPGWKKYKYFTVKNESTVLDDINYKIHLNVESSNFFTQYSETIDVKNLSGTSYMTYSLYKCETSQQDCNQVIIEDSMVDIQTGDKLISSRTIAKDAIDYYALKMQFPNLNEINQSQYGTDGNSLSFSAYVVITN